MPSPPLPLALELAFKLFSYHHRTSHHQYQDQDEEAFIAKTMDSTASQHHRRLQAVSGHISLSPPLLHNQPQKQTETRVPQLVLVLPDGGKVTIVTTTPSTRGAETHELDLNGATSLCSFQVSKNEEEKYGWDVCSLGTRYYEGREAMHVPKYPVVRVLVGASGSKGGDEEGKVWAMIYAFLTLWREQEWIPVLFLNAEQQKGKVERFLEESGLGIKYPVAPGSDKRKVRTGEEKEESLLWVQSDEILKSHLLGPSRREALKTRLIFLSRAAFWQGAGTVGYHSRGWLPFPRLSPFPSVITFTRNDKVIATHPVRPPKPAPGQVLYRRWCPGLNETLEITYFDAGSSSGAQGVSNHMAAFHKWHNDERVNSAWGERGSLETHREYVEGLLKDPHVWPCMLSWDGELMGYTEIVWVKENHVAQHYPTGSGVVPGDWERGIHVLAGENKFVGKGRSEAWIRSLVHFIFLSDIRTDRVAGEPSELNKAILQVALKSGFNFQSTVDFPYKRSVLVLNNRDRFFRLCRL